MAVVGYATIQLIPSVNGFAPKIESQIGGPTRAVGERAGKASGGAFSGGFIGAVGKIAAAAGIYSAISGITSGFKNAVQTGLEGVANLQSYTISFDTLLGSASKAKDMIAELYDFAARTPFDVQGSIVGAQKLLGVGVAAQDIIPTLTTLGDAVGAVGGSTDQFNQVLLAYSQIVNRPKLSTQDLYQVMNAGIPIFQLLSKALGLPIGEIQKLIETSKLASADVLPKLLAVMNQDYGGAMAKQAATLGGLFSTFKDTVQQSLTTALTPLAGFLQDNLPGATVVAQNAIQGISDGFQAVVDFFSAHSDTFGAAFEPFKEILEGTDWKGLLDGIGTSLGGVALALAPIVEGVGNVLSPIVPPLVDALNQLTASAPPAGDAVGGANQKMGENSQKVTEAANGYKELTQQIPLVNQQYIGLQATLQFTADAISPVIGGFVGFGAALGDNSVRTNAWSRATRGDFGVAFQVATLGLQSFSTSVATKFASMYITIGRFAASIGPAIKIGFDSMLTPTRAAFASLAAVIQAGVDIAVDKVRGIRDKIAGFFAGAGVWLISSGRELIGGFVAGIESAIGRVRDAAGRITSAAGDFFPHSPAKEGAFSGKGWTLYSGRALVDGFATGIQQRTPGLRRVMQGAFATPSVGNVRLGTVTGGGLPGLTAAVTSAPQRGGAYIGAVNFQAQDRNAGMVQDLSFMLRTLDRGGR